MTTLKVAVVPVTAFQQNASIVWDASTMKAAVVDPGGDLDRLEAAIAELRVTVEKILITHGHIDHAGGAMDLSERLNVPIEGPHEADRLLLAGLPSQARSMGLPPARTMTPTRWLQEGETVSVGAILFEVLHVPGHAPGHVVFVQKEANFTLVGDTLFQGSIGRTDLPGGDHALLIKGIKEKLFALGDDMTVLPGHGPATTIGRERRTNPFLV